MEILKVRELLGQVDNKQLQHWSLEVTNARTSFSTSFGDSRFHVFCWAGSTQTPPYSWHLFKLFQVGYWGVPKRGKILSSTPPSPLSFKENWSGLWRHTCTSGLCFTTDWDGTPELPAWTLSHNKNVLFKKNCILQYGCQNTPCPTMLFLEVLWVMSFAGLVMPLRLKNVC